MITRHCFFEQITYNGKIMPEAKTYSINASRAISENLDGETIIINLETGSYYSLNHS